MRGKGEAKVEIKKEDREDLRASFGKIGVEMVTLEEGDMGRGH